MPLPRIMALAAAIGTAASGAIAGSTAAPDFARIDAYALAAPAGVERSVESLAAYLAQGATGDTEKARAIFRWMADRVVYDVERLRAGRIESIAPDEVLRTRRSVCSGYADLFTSLAKLTGLEAVSIAGHAKGVGYEVGSSFDGPTNHAWNAVRIDGRWCLVDCTWGAGSVGPEMRFDREFRPFFFLTPPERLIYTHLPADSRWQLLEPSISLERFERMVHMRALAFDLGMAPLDPKEGRIKSRDRESVRVAIGPGTDLMARIARDGHDLDETLVWIQERGGTAEIDCIFPEAGPYRLDIFGKRGADATEYGLAMSYRIEASSGAGAGSRFPMRYSRYGESGAELLEPKSGILRAGRVEHFAIRVPGSRSVAVVIGNDFHDLRLIGDRFEGDVKPQRGRIGIYAAFGDGKEYEGLVEYEAR